MLSQHRRAQIGLAAAALVFSLAFTVVLAGSLEKPNLRVGLVGSPDVGFRLPSVDGSVVSSKSLRGSVAVICFATTPQESANAIARMAQLGRTFAENHDVRLVAIFSNADDMDQNRMRELKQTAADVGPSCSVLLDPSSWTATRYKVDGDEPTFFVIDANGMIRYRGEVDDPSPGASLASASFDAIINLLLAERPQPSDPAPAVLGKIK